MDLLFGDATTAMPTPVTQGERDSLMSASSPIPSLDIRRQYGQSGADNAIPGLDIDPPNVSADDTGKYARPSPQGANDDRSEGFGGWISSMVNRHKSSKQRAQGDQYRRLDQEEND